MKRASGFTLIELMVAVAVVGLLAALAYPSYLGSVRKSNRGAAQAFMMDVSQREQQLFLDRRSYAAVNAADPNDCNALFPANLNMVVPGEVINSYNICVTLPAGPPPTFVITATAKNNQTDDGDMTLNSQGTKTRTGVPSGW